ncbi:MAG TPA: choice-of-anchor Q domain-containing protein, partial [Caldilinea sp.]|nr:choice-of-anchor Q domain-containing protein [Caldilinea sp.]
NSTFGGNSAGAGGAIQNFLGPANLYYVTLAGNNGGVGGVLDQSAYAGYVDDSRQRFNVYHTALAQVANCAISGTAGPLPHFVSGGYNLAEDDSCAFFMNQPGDLNGVPAQLEGLADNGGGAWTHLPSAGSSLIDAAPCLPDFNADQRGVSRPQGARCDIGAVEVQTDATPPPTVTPPSPPTVQPPPPNVGEPIQATIGDGSPASCTAAMLAAAISAGGLITLDCGPNPVTIAGGPYTVAGDVSMDGGGLITLSGENAHRLFRVQPGASLRLANLILADGSAVEGAGSILNEGTLVLDTVTIRNSKTTGVNSGGGAITNLAGTLTIFGSQLVNNEAAYTGGALSLNDGITVIENSVIDGNMAQTFGAIDSTGDLTIRNSTIRGNRSHFGDGGGIGVIKGTATIEESLIEENFAAAGGGGLYVSPNYPGTAVVVRDTRILDNEADVTFAGSLGGGLYNGANVTLERVTVDGNRAYNAGGLFQYGNKGLLTVRDSTVSNNSAVHVAGGLQLSGALGHFFTNVTISGNAAADWAGGLYVVDYPAALQNVTLFGNRAPIGANLYNVRTTLTFTSTILGNPQDGGANCEAEGSAQPVISGGYNIDSDATCNLAGVGDQSVADPQLGPLVDNGGSTLTHAPLSGSPAIDAAAAACTNTDQRGYLRPAGVGCDAGAVEASAVAPAPSVVRPLPPLQPVAANYLWQGNLNLPVIQYPLPKVVIPGLNDAILLRGKRSVDVSICLYRTDMGGATNPNREPYENIIDFFADGLYEMTEGAHILRYVTFTYGCTPGVSGNITGTDTIVSADSRESYNNKIIWLDRVWPHVTNLSGWGATGSHLYISDIFSFTTPLNALSPASQRSAGYTLAHEWGHFMYGMGDEYRTTAACRGTYSGPCTTDMAIAPSVMSSQFNATAGDYTWLNFSTSRSETNQNHHYRIYQADAWTTLARPPSQDPPEIYRLPYPSLALPRTYFEELAAVAPAPNASPTIQLPANDADLANGIARRALQILWRREGEKANNGGPVALEPNLTPFQRCLSCPERVFGRNEFVYPNPAEFNVQLQRELPITNMQVVAQVKAPDGSQFQAPVVGDGVGGYVAQLPYAMGGQHQVTFTFTNPNLRATFSNAGLHYVPSTDGSEPPDIETPVGVPFTVTVSTVYTVTGFQADDHADTVDGATALANDNEPVLGRIDRSNDVDVFTATASAEGSLV